MLLRGFLRKSLPRCLRPHDRLFCRLRGVDKIMHKPRKHRVYSFHLFVPVIGKRFPPVNIDQSSAMAHDKYINIMRIEGSNDGFHYRYLVTAV